MDSQEKYIAKKPKLPRKRKKTAIKAQGREWYSRTIQLYKITQRNRRFHEPVCKFWVNNSIKGMPVVHGGKVVLIPVATRYW